MKWSTFFFMQIWNDNILFSVNSFFFFDNMITDMIKLRSVNCEWVSSSFVYNAYGLQSEPKKTGLKLTCTVIQ